MYRFVRTKAALQKFRLRVRADVSRVRFGPWGPSPTGGYPFIGRRTILPWAGSTPSDVGSRTHDAGHARRNTTSVAFDGGIGRPRSARNRLIPCVNPSGS